MLCYRVSYWRENRLKDNNSLTCKSTKDFLKHLFLWCNTLDLTFRICNPLNLWLTKFFLIWYYSSVSGLNDLDGTCQKRQNKATEPKGFKDKWSN